MDEGSSLQPTPGALDYPSDEGEEFNPCLYFNLSVFYEFSCIVVCIGYCPEILCIDC